MPRFNFASHHNKLSDSLISSIQYGLIAICLYLRHLIIGDARLTRDRLVLGFEFLPMIGMYGLIWNNRPTHIYLEYVIYFLSNLLIQIVDLQVVLLPPTPAQQHTTTDLVTHYLPLLIHLHQLSPHQCDRRLYLPHLLGLTGLRGRHLYLLIQLL